MSTKYKKLSECSRDEVLERYRRAMDRLSAKDETIKALEKRIVDERSGRRVANRRADEAEKLLRDAKDEISKRIKEIERKEEQVEAELLRQRAVF